MTKYIFVTGGVVSSLGKGITAASIGCLLKSCGLRVSILKIDPYLNVDPGTMSPFQHGEVFVTEDGAETDLDLGHYERFLDTNLTQDNNITSGMIYDAIITKERKGDFLGKTVQVIPHITDEIKSRIKKLGNNCDIVIVEVGGTTGDIEGLPFLEAIRQFRQDVGPDNVCYIHVTLVPYIRAAEEMKTKPTQQSVAKLREIGIEPQIIICRTEKPLSEESKKKIALFCNVQEESVIEERDVAASIYEVPLTFRKEKLDQLILELLSLKVKKKDLFEWEKIIERISKPQGTVTIAIAGKYTQLKDAYKSIWEALNHGGIANKVKTKIKYVNVEKENLEKELHDADGILIPGGFGDRGIEGKINTVSYAREKKIPFLGICLGMQCAVIEFARNVCGMKGANSAEFNPQTSYPVIDLLPEQKKVSQKGGTMRLGKYPCKIKKGSLAHLAYKKDLIFERHRHRYELNNKFRKTLESYGLGVTGEYEKRKLAEIVELKNHPWFVAVQFHPEFKSRPVRAHPLFREFIKASIKFSANKDLTKV
ncbi:MAG TPA: CTP synthase [Elusimicrobia bacterium]|jgi:CTP synthase|nr:CTP synthase [Elusimicrobiota bacterium]